MFLEINGSDDLRKSEAEILFCNPVQNLGHWV